MLIANLITADSTMTIAEQGRDGLEISGAVVRRTLNEVSSAALKFPATNKTARSILSSSRPVVEILDDSARVFYGPIVSVKIDIFGNTEYECDGAMAFLSDIVKAPFTVTNKTHAEYILAIINQYNDAVSAERQVWFGGVLGFENDGNVNIDHHDEFVSTLALFREAVEKYGGYIYETFGSGSVRPYIGWMKEPEIDSGKVLEFGVNELTVINQLDFSEYASRVYATTSDGTPIPSYYIASAHSENAYGRRDFAVHSSSDSVAETMLEAENELIKRKYPIKTIELTALDLERLGANYSGFALGTTATMIDARHGISTTMMVNTVERDLIDKQNGKIILGRAPATLTNSLVR